MGSDPLKQDRSRELHARALRLMPGGVNSPVRSMAGIGRDPLYVAAASGCTLTDADGNAYIDWVGSWGPMICGHAHPAVLDAITRAAERGTSFGAPTEAEVDLAAEVVDRVASVEMVRLVNSGTEAAMSAIRVARAATGRDLVVKFAGGYHGHSDGLLADAGSGLATHGTPASPGVPKAFAGATVVAAWNDLESVDAAFGGQPVAAVICEPIAANMGVIPPAEGFLESLRDHCDRAGALLIFDEVITGFRVSRGGAQELLGVEPDLTVMGKVLGGGLPLAAYGGPAELMSLVSPVGETYQAGTLSGNPLATAAGLATLEQLTPEAYARLGELTDLLAEGLTTAARQAGADVSVVSAPGLVTPFFATNPPPDFERARRCDHDAYAVFCRGLLERGIYPPPSGYEAWFVSLAHDEAAIDETVAAADEAIAEACG